MSEPTPTENTSLSLAKALMPMMMLDSFRNELTRTGFGTSSLMEATQYPLTRLTRDYNLMNSLYRNSWITRRIIDTIPKDMLKNWVKYESEIAPEEIDLLHRMERMTRLRRSLLKGLNWGRLYGGAAGLIMLDGQDGEMLSEPLDLDTIMPGDFKGLQIVDRWAGVYPDSELVTNPGNVEFGLPKYYEFRDYAQQFTSKVHHSRIVRFIGCDLPEWEMQAETYWGSSVIENVFEELKKRDNVSANIANLTFLASLRVLRMADLGELMATSNVNSQRDLYNIIQGQNQLMNNFGMYLMSAEDEFQIFKTSFEGLDEVYESFMLDLAGAAQIPVTKLFGRSPAGMNATGESDLRNYYDVIEQEQEANLRPQLEKLLPVLCLSTLGYIPDDIDFTFNPVETPTEDKIGEAVKWKSEAIFNAHDRGLISDRVGMQELKQLSEGSGVFTSITDEDINAANDKAEPKEMLMPGEDGPLDESLDKDPEGVVK